MPEEVSPEPRTENGHLGENGTEVGLGRRFTRTLGTRVGILNGEDVFEALGRDSRIGRTQFPEASRKILLLGLGLYAVAIASLPFLGGKTSVAFFFAVLGIVLTVVGDFLRKRTSGGHRLKRTL
ncbi:MAG: hypothetical protein ACE5IO_01365 [Thermoplasmata archaeon]